MEDRQDVNILTWAVAYIVFYSKPFWEFGKASSILSLIMLT